MDTVRQLLAVGVNLAVILAAAAQGVAPSGEIDVNALIRRLGSGQFAEREAAAQELETLGGPALDGLRQAARSPDLEVRRRADELVGKIEIRQESSRLLVGKKIRLAYHETPLKEAWEDFTKRSGFSLRISSTDQDLAGWESRTLSLTTEEISLWEALDRMCTVIGLVQEVPVAGGTAANALILRAGKSVKLPTYYAGALRIRALATQSPGWGQTPGVVDVPCLLEILPEPGIQWQGLLDVRIHRAIDEKGQTLEPCPTHPEENGDEGLADFQMARIRLWQSDPTDTPWSPNGPQTTVKLKLAKQPSSMVQELHGTLIGQMQTPPEALLTINDILQSAGQSFKSGDGSQLKIGQILREKDGRIQIDIEHQGPVQEEAVPLNLGLNNRRFMNGMLVWKIRSAGKITLPFNLEIQDALGRKLEIVRYNEESQQNGMKVQYAATLHVLPKAGAGDPARLVLVGRRPATVEVPFTLKNVPLP